MHETDSLLNGHDSGDVPKGNVSDASWAEIWLLTKSATPLAFTFLLQFSLLATSIYAAGKLGPVELAAVSLADSSLSITAVAIYQGLATSLDTLCSQAYGSGKYTQVGLLVQRGALQGLLITLFPLSIIWWFSGIILGSMIPEQDVADIAQSFLRCFILGAPGLMLFETGKRFLQVQGLFNAGTYAVGIAAPLNFFLHWFLVWNKTTGLGVIGAPIALNITYWFMSLYLLFYVMFVDGKKCWGGFDRSAFRDWLDMLKLAVPGTVTVAAEYLTFELLTILSASFGTYALAAQSIAGNIAALLFQVPFAISVMFSTTIGYHIGRNNIPMAIMITNKSTIFGIIIAIFNFSVIFFFRDVWCKVFTDSSAIIKEGSHILILTSLNQIADAFNVIGAGVLRGQGRQTVGFIVSVLGYYLIALPTGYVLAFVFKLELTGLWIGLIMGVLCLAIGQYGCIFTSNWPSIVSKTVNRLN